MAVVADYAAEPEPKRRKLTTNNRAARQPSNINSVQDLERALTFEQDIDAARQSVQRFKSFLLELKHGEQLDSCTAKREALREFLSSGRGEESGAQAQALSGLFQTWHFAKQMEHDVLCSSIPATISLLLKYMSSDIDYRDLGVAICEQLLHEDQLKLIDRNFTAQKSKEHLIEPCLRLLTEIVSFDGGSSAKLVYRRRFITLQRLDVFLGITKSSDKNAGGDRRRVSVREASVHYFLANLRLQEKKGKEFLLGQPRLSRALLQHLSNDPNWLASYTFEVLERDVLKDSMLDRAVLRRFFNSASLLDLANLYEAADASESDVPTPGLRNMAHKLLGLVCASSYALLNVDRDFRQSDILENDADFTSRADDDEAMLSSTKKIALASIRMRFVEFFHRLRPHADLLQAELIIQTFRHHPQLMPEYFQHKSSFNLDPKLSMTWLGHSRFILACIQGQIAGRLLASQNFKLDSATDLLVCILPQPCTRKALTKCFSQAGIISFTAVNILNAAFGALEQLLRALDRTQSAEDQTSTVSDLRTLFMERCPDVKLLIGLYHAQSKERLAHRQAIARLLANYYQLVPEVALEAKFDLSTDLSIQLSPIRKDDIEEGRRKLQALESGDLVRIAKMSPNVQWLNKSSDSKISLFTTLLSHTCRLPRYEWGSWVKIASAIATEYRIFQPAHCLHKSAILIQLLVEVEGSESNEIFQFLDICFTKVAVAPVKYYDKLLDLVDEDGSANIVQQTDLLLVSVWDQWAHLNVIQPEDATKSLARWLGRLFRYFSQHVEVDSLASEVFEHVILSTVDEENKTLLSKNAHKLPEATLSVDDMQSLNLDTMGYPVGKDASQNGDIVKLEERIPPAPPSESGNHPELHRWQNMAVEDAILDGAVGKLCLCLCSQSLAIRKEALTGLKIFQTKLETSQATFPDWQQEFLLLLEVIETATGIIPDRQFPYFAAVLFAECAVILTDPLHVMYVKVNHFLQRAPLWNTSRLPKQWIKDVILSEPTEAGKYFEEVDWLLSIVLDGLRTFEDMVNYQTCHLFEYIQSTCNSPWTPSHIVEKTIDILFRCVHIGGSTILITKFAIQDWISAICTFHEGEHRDILRMLSLRLDETCDKRIVDQWKEGSQREKGIADRSVT